LKKKVQFVINNRKCTLKTKKLNSIQSLSDDGISKQNKNKAGELFVFS